MSCLQASKVMDDATLKVSSLTKAFAKTVAVDGLDFEVPQGGLTVLLGPAGSGKTTSLRMIAGLEQPDRGSVVLRQRDVTSLEPKDRDIAMIFDNLALYPNKTGFGNLAHPLQVAGVPRDAVQARVDEISATLRIAHILNRLPKTMSGGERQRVALGRALVRTPSLFLLDEPLSSLDAMLRIELRAELKRLQRQFSFTFLLATPDYAEAFAVADTVIMLRKGKVVQVATAQSLYDEPADREIARFVGAPEINILDAEYRPGANASLGFAGAAFPALPEMAAMPVRFQVGLRPEHLALTQPSLGQITGVVADIESLGVKAVVTVANEAAELRVMIDSDIVRKHALGDRVGVIANLERLHFFETATGARLPVRQNRPLR